MEVRGNVSALAVQRITNTWKLQHWLVGEGALSAAEVAHVVANGYTTLDNAILTTLFERGLPGLIVFYGSFLVILWRTRKMAFTSLHWYNPLALLATSVSFDFEAYSTFNILAVGSIAILTAKYVKYNKDIAGERVAIGQA